MQRAKLGQGYVYHGVASSLYLTKVCKHLGTKEFSAGHLGEKCCPIQVRYRILAD